MITYKMFEEIVGNQLVTEHKMRKGEREKQAESAIKRFTYALEETPDDEDCAHLVITQ